MIRGPAAATPAPRVPTPSPSEGVRGACLGRRTRGSDAESPSTLFAASRGRRGGAEPMLPCPRRHGAAQGARHVQTTDVTRRGAARPSVASPGGQRWGRAFKGSRRAMTSETCIQPQACLCRLLSATSPSTPPHPPLPSSRVCVCSPASHCLSKQLRDRAPPTSRPCSSPGCRHPPVPP